MKSLSKYMSESLDNPHVTQSSVFLALDDVKQTDIRQNNFITIDDLRKIHDDIVKTEQELVNASSKELHDAINAYIDTNDKGRIGQIMNCLESDKLLKKAVEDHNYNIRYAYRGITLDKDMSDDDIYDTDCKNQFVSCTRDKVIAHAYATKPPAIGKVITYRCEPSDVIIDFDMFRSIINVDKYQSELIITPRSAELYNIDTIKYRS